MTKLTEQEVMKMGIHDLQRHNKKEQTKAFHDLMNVGTSIVHSKNINGRVVLTRIDPAERGA